MKQSYVTVHDKEREKIQKMLIESDLYKVEQAKVKKVKETQLVKQQNKQSAVNLIKITTQPEEYKSVKMETRDKSARRKASVKGKD